MNAVGAEALGEADFARFRELVLRAWVERVEGRRIMSRAEMYDGDTLTAEAEGLFVQPRPEVAHQYFGPRA